MFAELDISHYSLWVAIVAGVLVFGLALVLGHRTGRRVEEKSKEEDEVKKDPFQHGSGSEKRRSFRRKGKSVLVEVTDKEVQGKPWRGWVMDRSLNGIRVNVDSQIVCGTELNIRVADLNPPMPWLAVKVANSKSGGQGWELGCQFISTPTWNIMLMFG